MDIEVAADLGDAEELPYPRDLLRRFAGTSCNERPPRPLPEAASEPVSAEKDMDLSLGLSLGGCFAVESSEKRLVRSSSVAAFPMISKEKDVAPPVVPLVRTCSLPVETEAEHRKRKEMQSLKRMEAKRKRSEKRNSSVIAGRPVSAPDRPPGLRRSSSDLDGVASRGYEIPVLNSIKAEVGNSSTLRSAPEAINKSAAGTPPVPVLRSLVSLGEDDEAMKRMSGRIDGSKDMKRDMMKEMPCVSTKGDGPNGRRIEGFLYKYRKGEEVRIVCVCHGSFLTPAEFIKHAGGGDVDHPLRHIVVNPSPSAYY